MLLIPAPAKINLCLALRGRLADGYHRIDSVATTIDWHDLIGVTVRSAAETVVRLRLSGDRSLGAPPGEDNLVIRAAAAMALAVGPLEVDLWLHKRIPAEAGLGGGSADAAAVLRAINTLLTRTDGGERLVPEAVDAVASGGKGDGWRRPVGPAVLHGIAASLGSDVPLGLTGGTQRMEGRGDLLTRLPPLELHLAVAVAGRSATATAYSATRAIDHEDSARVNNAVVAIRTGQIPAPDDLGSGLERAAGRAHPRLDERLTALRAAIPEVRWHLTGSGGAAFAIAHDRRVAEELASAARAIGFPARACRTTQGRP